MAGYCDQCERHCPLDALGCGRGYRKYGNQNEANSGREHSREDRSNAAYSGETLRGPRDGMREEHGEPHHDRREGRFPHDEPRRHGRHDEPCRCERPDHGPHGRPPRDHFDEPHGAPHRGHPGHGPSAEELQDRLETGNLSELMHMCGHVLHRRPEADAARGQGKVLAILTDEGSVSQKLLQEALHIQPGSMSEIVTKLENKGLLTRTRGQDRRGNVLSITEEGRKAAQKEDPSAEDLFCALSEEQQYQLRTLLQTLLTDWLKRFDSRFANRD